MEPASVCNSARQDYMKLHKTNLKWDVLLSDRANQIRGSDIMVAGWESSIDNVWVILALFPRKIAAYKYV